jgi:sorbitol-6-phosphate 2-dehydrogenase
MDAIVIEREGTSPTVRDIEPPEPAADEALIRTLSVGIDGTDFEVIEGNHGGFPPGEAYQILGHEAVGVIEETPGERFSSGDLVVPTVRRPRDNAHETPGATDLDMAPSDVYVERGIDGAHGFMAEYITSPIEYLVRLPPGLADSGILVEPLSNIEKAIEHALAARSAFDWTPTTGFVLGNGPLGLLALTRLEVGSEVDELYCLGRRSRPDPTIDLIERLGATYVDSRETSLPAVPATYGSMDLVIEATGVAEHAFEAIETLAPGGVGALLGLPPDDTIEIPGGRYHESMVMGNKAVIGSVNSHRRHYRAAIETLEAVPAWVPETLITRLYPAADYDDAFAGEGIKSGIRFATLGDIERT